MSATSYITRLPEHEQAVFHLGERHLRLYRYVRDHGPCNRDAILHWCGFPSPKVEPVSAYVRFHNVLLRVNAALARHGYSISGGIETRQVYSLVQVRA